MAKLIIRPLKQYSPYTKTEKHNLTFTKTQLTFVVFGI